MSFQPEILLLDEPTSALATREVEQLFDLIRRLRARGITMIYITHRMNELFAIADSCTVLRDGRVVGAVAMADATPDMIVGMMFGGIGRAHRSDKAMPARAKPALEVRHLGRRGVFADISFDLHAGEVLGIAGLMGAGRTELLRAIFGADPVDSGEVRLDGRPVKRPSPKVMKRLGLGYTPENRKEVGLVQMLSSHDNLCLASLARITRHGVTSRRRETPFVRRQIRDLDIKVSDPMLPVSSLSGGNQQKIVVGNWLNTLPSVMLFDEPTRGIDVQAKQQIFEIIWRKAGEGLAVVFVSSELEELLDVADRILVLRHGRIVGETEPKDTSLAELYRLCMEGRPDEP
jgi:ribose transport system ATP-binding protein